MQSQVLQPLISHIDLPNNTDLMMTTCRSLLFLHHGIAGTLYRSGEYVLCHNHHGNEIVIHITEFYSLALNNAQIFVKGELFPFLPGNQTHIYSSNLFVQPSSNPVCVPASDILSKQMLFPDPDHIHSPSKYIVINYARKRMPITEKDVIFPFYTQAGDIVLVIGQNEENWHSHV